jgi:hypothetical protein
VLRSCDCNCCWNTCTCPFFCCNLVAPIPIAKACVPAPTKLLAVAKVPGDVVQLVPSYYSVAPVIAGADPPKPNPAVCSPAPPTARSCCI